MMDGMNLYMTKGLKVGKFWFEATMPDEVVNACKDLLIRNESLIPSWCEEVRIYFDAEGTDTSSGGLASAYIETNYSYRFANLTICPPFLCEELQDRDNRIKHELSHIVTAPLIYYVRDIVGMMTKDEILCSIVSREMNEKVESVTEDLTNIFVKTERKFTNDNR